MKYTQDIELQEGLIDLIITRLNDISAYDVNDEEIQNYFNEDMKNVISLALMEKGRQHYK